MVFVFQLLELLGALPTLLVATARGCYDELLGAEAGGAAPVPGRAASAEMVNATQGVLLECDIAMKQFILSMNEERPQSERFIIYDLDDTHLMVQPHVVDELQARIREFQDKNTFTAPTA